MQYSKKNVLDRSQEKLLNLIRSGKFYDMDTEEIQNSIGVAYYQAINNKLKQLENKGYIRKGDGDEYMALKEPINDFYHFPIIGFAQCGNIGASIDDVRSTERFAFSTKDLNIKSSAELKNFFFTRSRGESMLPIINNDDLLLIKHQVGDSTPADNSLIIHNGKPKIKKVVRNENGTYTLISLNSSFQPIVTSPNDELEVVGVVKKIIKSA